MSKGISKALRIEANEYLRNREALKDMLESGDISEAEARERRRANLVKMLDALGRESGRKRGRPRIAKLDITQPTGMLYQADPPKLAIGRPKGDKEWWFELVYATVEEERARLVRERKTRGSVTAAIKSLLKLRLAPAMDWREGWAIDEKFESIRADYRRGKELAKAEKRKKQG